MISAYFDEWKDRFYLLDDEHPFMQVSKNRFEVDEDTKDKSNPTGHRVMTESAKGRCVINYRHVKSWVGTIRESENTKSPFINYSDIDEMTLSYAEAARWLVWFLSYSPCFIKNPKYFNSKRTWASGGTLVTPYGENLHETIMFNSVLLFRKTPYEKVSPIWEREVTPGCEYAPYGENGHPDNLPEIYTQQSRKVRLYEKDGRIIGMFAVSGDYYGKTDAFIEPMYMWRRIKGKNEEPDVMKPISRNENAPIWKDLPYIIPQNENDKPGVVSWIGLLYENENIIDEDVKTIPYQITGVKYGTMDSALDKSIEDEIVIDKKYFDPDISIEFEDVISDISKISDAVYKFSKEMALSMGADVSNIGVKASMSKLKYEENIGVKVLQCLEGLIDIETLRKIAFSQAITLTANQVERAPISAYIGHNGHTIAKAEKWFTIAVNKLRKKEIEQ